MSQSERHGFQSQGLPKDWGTKAIDKMENIFQAWLFQQCHMLNGAIRAVMLTGPPDTGPYDQTQLCPNEPFDHAVLHGIAQVALQKKQAVIKTRCSKMKNTGEPLDTLACPLFFHRRLMGVVAIEMTHRSQSLQQAAVRQVQIGVRWLETILQLHGATTKEQLINLVDLVAAGLDHEDFRVAACEVANELAERFSCHRVSLGFLRCNRIQVEALSHTSRINQHSNLVRAIRDAMSESLDQGATILYPPDSEDTMLVTRFHAQLAKAQKGATICTVPLVKNGKAVGALLLERISKKPFSAETREQCEQIGLLIGPVLEIRRRNERSLPFKIVESCQNLLAKLIGPRYLALKAGAGLVVALALWLSLATVTFHISSDSVLEAKICHSVVAPQNGYIASANVRAGDLVRKGELMAMLDDHELRLEQRKWQSQSAQYFKEYRKALAVADRAEIAILKAKRAQAEAQLRLVEQQLERTSLLAPISGLVVRGDLRRAIGSPVERGDVLYEVAHSDDYLVVLNVDDRDIELVAPGQRGQLKLSGIPDLTIGVSIDRITPVSTSEGGHNYFRVEALMESHFLTPLRVGDKGRSYFRVEANKAGTSLMPISVGGNGRSYYRIETAVGGYGDLMRPGMKGVVNIEIRQAKLLWVWTRGLVDWLKLVSWRRLP